MFQEFEIEKQKPMPPICRGMGEKPLIKVLCEKSLPMARVLSKEPGCERLKSDMEKLIRAANKSKTSTLARSILMLKDPKMHKVQKEMEECGAKFGARESGEWMIKQLKP